MTQHKIAELDGAPLDVAVAIAMQLTFQLGIEGCYVFGDCVSGGNRSTLWAPSIDWATGGPIIEQDQIFLNPPSSEHHHGGSTPGWNKFDFWRATVSANTRRYGADPKLPGALGAGHVGRGAGPTPLIAAMRAKVASHFGEFVELP